MKTGHRKIIFIILITAVLAFSTLASNAEAKLKLSFSGDTLSYFIVDSPEIIKQGETINVDVTGKLAIPSNQSEAIHVTFYVDTELPAIVISERDFVLPGDAAERTAQYSVTIPMNALNGTYLRMKITHGDKTISDIHLSLIQTPTYNELAAAFQNLQSQTGDLTESNNTLIFLVYIATFVAVVFAGTTIYVIAFALRLNKKRKISS